ncbi:MAG TPA: peptide chain release factor N(5)-glutamine methyltransferase [Vicinamibacterales bacterium]|nr:peptide chain release factor N(5)-glutamine methyltransferase [Vicinamibacterales bacterium]
MPSVAERLTAARRQLEAAGFPPADAALDAEVLARHLLGWDRADLIVRGRDPEPPGFSAQFDTVLARRTAHEPVAQIVGHREFWGLDFEVTRDVLIPRPETEIIVEAVLAFAAAHPCRRIADVGTGSGCLAVSIAHDLPSVIVTAVDVSPAALEVARRNAARHHVDDRVTLQQADVLAGVTGHFDLIVSNPPYVPEADAASMQEDVVRYEPYLALFGGRSGFEVIERLFDQSADHLASGGQLIVEFGFGQAGQISSLAVKAGWRIVRVLNDLQSIPRTIVLDRPSGDSAPQTHE